MSPCRLLAFVLLVPLPLAPAARPQGQPHSFEEAFALAPERAAVLERLVPGTEDDYFYRALHAQHTGALHEVPALLQAWIARHDRSERVAIVENRQALLSWERDRDATLAHLRERTGVRFDHVRQVPGAASDLPTRLDPSVVSWPAFAERARRDHPRSLNGFTTRALGALAASPLSPDERASLLKRLRWPDVPNLAALVLADLDRPDSGGFGSRPIHGELLLEQLDELARARPPLLADDTFVATYVRRLRPGPDEDVRTDPVAREAHLQRLESFARGLPRAQVSLLAHVLHHRLVHDRGQGVLDRARLLEYLRLPRTASWGNARTLGKRRGTGPVVDPSAAPPTGLSPVADDEPLVRDLLLRLFATEPSFEAFTDALDRRWLERVFAEAKLLAGAPDGERWTALLGDPSALQALRERVEIAFLPTLPAVYAPHDEVVLEVDVKNVETLLVNVFRIATSNVHGELGREVDAALDLDGLLPNEQHVLTFSEPPLRRVRRSVPLPSLAGPGTWIVELVGNGLASRAVIRKGALAATERVGAAGHVFRVHDEQGRHLPDAGLWMGGRAFTADEHGEIVVPFSTAPGRRTVVLRHGERSALHAFDHLEETYRLEAGVLVERETLLPGTTATLLVRPSLTVQGRPASLALLQQPRLTITAVDRDGVASVLPVREPVLVAGAELRQEVEVPHGLAELSVTLTATVARASGGGEEVALRAGPRTFTLNGIDATAAIDCPLLGRTDEGWVLDVLGKNGEPRAGRTVTVSFEHEDFTAPHRVALQTDADGRVHLGALTGIVRVRADGFPVEVGAWPLRDHAATLPERLSGAAGATLRVPFTGALARTEVSLLERRGGAFARDAFEHLSVTPGHLELVGLPSGEYELWLKGPDVRLPVAVTAGEPRDGWVEGSAWLRPVSPAAPAIASLTADGDTLRVALAGAGERTRVHVLATRWLPAFDPWESLRVEAPVERAPAALDRAASTYLAGRELETEERYILERRQQRRFPGNMLSRPSLLLHPWAIDELELVGERAESSASRGAILGAGGRSPRGDLAGNAVRAGPNPGTFPDFSFLPAPAVLLADLRPDEHGVLEIARAELGPGQLVHVVLVDGHDTAFAALALPQRPLHPRDLRQRAVLDPARHHAERRRIELLQAGEAVTVTGLATSELAVFDSLASVFRLFSGTGSDPELAAFEFLVRWPSLSPDEQRELASRHACHEVHLFLHEKDPAFFEQAVRPTLQCKLHKTFLDHWLLGDDLSPWLEPWAWARLNVLERALLARRLPDEAAAVARDVHERLQLLPPDPAHERTLLQRMLASASLGGAGGVHDALAEAQQDALALAEQLEALGYTGRGRAVGAAPGPRLDDETDLRRREGQAAFYRDPDSTRAYVESNYWKRPIAEQHGDLLPLHAFWLDVAEAAGARPFVSPHVAKATGSVNEMLLALAVLDLPFEAGEHELVAEGERVELRAATPLLLVHKQVDECEVREDAPPVLLGQDLFRLDDRYEWQGGLRHDKLVQGPLVVDVVYGTRAVVGNPTPSTRALELLLQVPEGALPVGGRATRVVDLLLEPFATRTVEQLFYFPQPGTFGHHPAHVAEGGAVVAFVEPATRQVLAEPPPPADTWAAVSQIGSDDEVLAFLQEANLHRLDLSLAAWRLRDRAFFGRLLDALRRRHAYDDVLWSYGLLHGDVRAIREFLPHQEALVARCGRWLHSPLLDIDPVERRTWQHVEYEPLFNARAHRVAGREALPDRDLAQQYADLLATLAYRPALDDADWLTVTYHLLLQDRVGEALAAFARVRTDGLPHTLQYDYARAYLGFFGEQPGAVRPIAEAHRDHPVTRWRERFREVLRQLDEAGGLAVTDGEGRGRTRQQTALAAAAPVLELAIEGRAATLLHGGLQEVELAYYPMDVEFLFSANPFLSGDEEATSAWVAPRRTDVLALDPDAGGTSVPLPAELAGMHVLVEARGGGLVRRRPSFASDLALRLHETQGQLQVTHAATGAPLPAVYVKVYARTASGSVRFHKDGYTDLRGRFDYTSVSAPVDGAAERYALLLWSEADGAVIREAAPPPR